MIKRIDCITFVVEGENHEVIKIRNRKKGNSKKKMTTKREVLEEGKETRIEQRPASSFALS
jgi:hypothetical protein